MLLNQEILVSKNTALSMPRYQRQRLGTGIVHLGLGAFHRAHQLGYHENYLNLLPADLSHWGVVGVSLRSAKVHNLLAPQDHLYTLVSLAEKPQFQLIGCLKNSLVAPEDPEAVLAEMNSDTTRIVSLTISEKGYYYAPGTQELLLESPEIAADLAHPQKPQTALGFIYTSLLRRRKLGLKPFTVLCCDNLTGNGHLLAKLVREFARQLDVEFANWIAEEVAFPSTMVDRITPATTVEHQQLVYQHTHLQDATPIATEPFSQWVIEDHFPQGRPAWEKVGVEFCEDVAPFENMKLKLLNGSHSTLAYAGYLAGFDTVYEAMQNKYLFRLIRDIMRYEIEPVLQTPEGVDLTAYQEQLIQRYLNPQVCYYTQQIAGDGSQKVPLRLLETLRIQLEKGGCFERLAFAVACWFHYLGKRRDDQSVFVLNDPLAARLEELLERAGKSASARVNSLMQESGVFPAVLQKNSLLAKRLVFWLARLQQQGCLATLAEIAATEAR